MFKPLFFVSVLGLSGLMGAAIWASNTGLGISTPKKTGISIRDGSTNSKWGSTRKGRHFVGGGLHGGK